jgi:hypothetical protein
MARTTRPASSDYAFDVQHTALCAADGTPSGWFGIQRTDNKKVIGVSSEKYGIVKNADVIDAVKDSLRAHGSTLGDFTEEVNVVRDGSRMYGVFDFKDFQRDIPLANRQVGDVVGMRLTANNSYDRSCRISLSVGMLRLACTNGMTTLESEQGLTKKHSLSVDVSFIRDAITDCITKFEASVEHLGKLSKTSITVDQGSNLLQNLTDKKVISEVVRVGISNIWKSGTIGVNTDSDQSGNLFNLYNAATQYLSREVTPKRFEYGNKVDKAILSKLTDASATPSRFATLVAEPKEKATKGVVVTA